MSCWIVAALSPEEVESFVTRLELGVVIQVFYGKNPNARVSGKDAQEARRAIEKGISPQQFTGRLQKTGFNGEGEFYFILKGVCEREGNFRAFNPSQGKLMKVHQLGRSRR